jgi:hypothetical protein
MSMNRRSFLGGFLAVTAVAVAGVPAMAKEAAIPTLWGDCIHDDTAALNALFAGNPVRVEGEDIIAKDAFLKGGRFLISDTIMIRNPARVVDVYFETSADFRGASAVVVEGRGISMTRITVQRGPRSPSFNEYMVPFASPTTFLSLKSI